MGDGKQLGKEATRAYEPQLGEGATHPSRPLRPGIDETKLNRLDDLARLLLQSRKYILIAESLVNDALSYEQNDKDLKQLKDRIESEKTLAQEYGTKFAPVNCSAQRYPENAYRLLEG